MSSDPTGFTQAADKLAKLADCEVVKKTYDDLAHSPAKEAGAALTDVVRGLRLLTVPFALAGNLADRLRVYGAAIRSRVPEDRQVEASPRVAGPVIEQIRYIPASGQLTDLFLQLLVSAIDRDRRDTAHPAFAQILGQLSNDEVLLVYELKRTGRITTIDECTYLPVADDCSRITTVSHTVSCAKLRLEARVHVSLMRLMALSLVDRPNYCEEINALERRQRAECLWVPSDFGAMFLEACVPECPFGPFAD